MKNLILIILIVFCCNILLAQESIVFDKIFNWEDGGAGTRGIKQTEDGGYICAGGAGWAMFDERYLIFKLDSLGNLEWQNYFSTKGSELFAVDITKTGNYITAGRNQNNEDWLLISTLIMFDQNGDTLWLKQYPATAEFEGETVSPDTYFNDVIFTSDNSIVAAGLSGYNSTSIPYVVKTDMNGDTLWTWMPLPFHDNNTIMLYSIDETPEGDYVAVGKADLAVYPEGKPNAPQRGIIVKLSSEGELIYFKEWTDLEYNLFQDLKINDAGELIIAGTFFLLPPEYDNVYNYTLLVKTDEFGETIFIKQLYYGRFSYAFSIALCENNDILLQNTFGASLPPEEWMNDILIQKLTPEGELVFQKSIGGQNVTTWYGEIISTNDNGIAFSGIFHGPRAWVVKMDSLGNGNYGQGWISKLVSNTFDSSIDIYPNPAFDKIYINIENNKDCIITLYTIDGKIIKKETLRSTQNIIEVNYLPNGVYLLEISENKHRYIEKIIINH